MFWVKEDYVKKYLLVAVLAVLVSVVLLPALAQAQGRRGGVVRGPAVAMRPALVYGPRYGVRAPAAPYYTPAWRYPYGYPSYGYPYGYYPYPSYPVTYSYVGGYYPQTYAYGYSGYYVGGYGYSYRGVSVGPSFRGGGGGGYGSRSGGRVSGGGSRGGGGRGRR